MTTTNKEQAMTTINTNADPDAVYAARIRMVATMTTAALNELEDEPRHIRRYCETMGEAYDAAEIAADEAIDTFSINVMHAWGLDDDADLAQENAEIAAARIVVTAAYAAANDAYLAAEAAAAAR